VQQGLKVLKVQLQPLLLGRRLLLITLELRALLTAALRALQSLILFLLMAPLALLVQLAPLAHRAQLALKALKARLETRVLLAPKERLVLKAQQVLKDHKAILELRGLQVRRVRQAPRVLRERLALLVLMVLMARLRRLRSVLPHLLQTRAQHRSRTAAPLVQLRSTLF
jgi:hypothetical protein